MDYEKKYKEALKRARAYNTPIANRNTKAILESVFPELADSEDERIRKYLIDELKVAKSVGELKFTIPQPTREECIAYLEKQKEQKHPNGCFTCDEYKKGYEAGRLNGFTAGYNKAMKEQKPAEWSEEDESELTAVIYCVSRAIKASKDENERNSLLSAKKWLQDKLSFRVKSLRPSWKPSEEQMKALELVVNFLKPRKDTYEPKKITELESLYEQLKKL